MPLHIRRRYKRLMAMVIIAPMVMMVRDYIHSLGADTPLQGNRVKVIDGDTLMVNGHAVRLKGIDAPELRQQCTDRTTEREWPCGEAAKAFLTRLIGHGRLSCSDEGRDRYQRFLSYCYRDDGTNINREMVGKGYALAYARFDGAFFWDEWNARLYHLGLWGSNFDTPAEWRKKVKG